MEMVWCHVKKVVGYWHTEIPGQLQTNVPDIRYQSLYRIQARVV